METSQLIQSLCGEVDTDEVTWYLMENTASYTGKNADKVRALKELLRRKSEFFKTQREKKYEIPPQWAKLFAERFTMLDHREAHVAFFTTDHTLIAVETIFKGGWEECPIDGRVVIKRALELGAGAIAVGHNNPTRMVTPTIADDLATERLKKKAEIMGIKFLDHIIIGTDKQWYSFERRSYIYL